MSEMATSEARAWGPSAAIEYGSEAYVACTHVRWPNRNPPSMERTSKVTELFISCGGRLHYYLFISAIGEIASAYVTIAASNRVKHMCNGNLHK